MRQKLTVRDLREHLERSRLSPERFAKQVQLSHMTIRRWLKKSDEQAIPQKYSAILGPRMQFGTSYFDVQQLMADVEGSGAACTDLASVQQDVFQKLKTQRFDQIFHEFCSRLYEVAKSPSTTTKVKAIAIGALLYFINPIDLIPDHTPVIGFVDDLAVLSLAAQAVAKAESQGRAKASGIASPSSEPGSMNG